MIMIICLFTSLWIGFLTWCGRTKEKTTIKNLLPILFLSLITYLLRSASVVSCEEWGTTTLSQDTVLTTFFSRSDGSEYSHLDQGRSWSHVQRNDQTQPRLPDPHECASWLSRIRTYMHTYMIVCSWIGCGDECSESETEMGIAERSCSQ